LAPEKPSIFCSFWQTSGAYSWMKAVLIMDWFVGALESNGGTNGRYHITGHRTG
jgi:hypothetical protein